ncbi:hypothetical protein [Anabaena sp. UHCC 0253]|uniref:hypothetical protein n=1 Tax=Anabaena sp. UHCC 0253 TaxID=2590019 RepID=UPI0014473ED5|nr:hypothetical protein [Anabaena sp. UHCC 0253]
MIEMENYQWLMGNELQQESGVVGAKHSENNLGQKLIIDRPNASPVQCIGFNLDAVHH